MTSTPRRPALLWLRRRSWRSGTGAEIAVVRRLRAADLRGAVLAWFRVLTDLVGV
ncbi:MAG: hypothetical protein IRZ07_05655 [Microbispora sp.]|nr:hypothetical protein [Microbispora sp.]